VGGGVRQLPASVLSQRVHFAFDQRLMGGEAGIGALGGGGRDGARVQAGERRCKRGK